MTIQRGQPWGGPAALPDGAAVVDGDAALAEVISASIDPADPPGSPDAIVVGLTGGDLHRTLGSPMHTVDELRSGSAMGFPIDVGVLEAEDGTIDRPLVFTAHMIATSSSGGTLWRGRTIIAMNAAFNGDQNLAPRGHPNDGRLDVIDGALGTIDRRRALARTRTGSHLPHPGLKVAHVRERRFVTERPLTIHLDGVRIGKVGTFTLRCIPDAATIVV